MTQPRPHPVLLNVQQMLQEFRIPEKARVLVGVSGGLDSMVLLHVLHALEYDVTAAHVNFQLRGDASDSDARHVQAWCALHAIPCLMHQADTKAYSVMFDLNTQLAAREIRYKWLEQVVRENAFDYVATGHHLDDSIETLLMNVFRGTGIKGLQGIPARRDHYIRPLLRCTRQELEAYGVANAITFRTDVSNLSDHYQRNRIRHHLIPEIREAYPDYTSRFRHTLHRLALEWNDIDGLYRQWIEDHVRPDKDGFHLKSDAGQKSFLLRWLEEKDIPWNLAFHYIDANEPEKGRVLSHGKWQLSRTNTGFFLNENHPVTEFKISAPGFYTWGNLECTIEKTNTFIEGSDPPSGSVYVKGSVLRWPLTIRKVIAGDHFQPFGMNGQTKKLQDLMVDLKLEPYQKKRLWVLENPEHILWVIGLRLDERCRIMGAPEDLYKITFTEVASV